PPTFGVKPGRVQALVAGGRAALCRSVDPGSNPGTSTTIVSHNGLKRSFVGVVRSRCALSTM
ncbi:MAG TPA: hypothetical protein EYP01_03875, partial [Candidatus Poseidoniales archaeon]|nr:hypothetical protein [Candidatus Poseidoniales archaeon]